MKPLIIGITGGSGSGKTTLIKKLKKVFRPEDVCIISQDDYYFPREFQKVDENGVINFDLPKGINKKGFNKDLKQLIQGKEVNRQEYVFNNPKANAKALVFRPAPIIVVEGLFVFHFKKIRKKLDLKIYVHAKENLKVIRRIKRDQVERNYPIEDVLYRYEHHVLPSYEKYIQPYINDADIVINNNRPFEQGLQVVIGFMKNFLDEQKKPGGDFQYRFFEEE